MRNILRSWNDVPQELNGIPVYYDHLSWPFLGAPLTTESQTCITSALDRFLLVNKRIGELALQHPEEALAVTRFCAGACKVLHILQAGLPPSQHNMFLAQCSASLKETLEAIVGATLSQSQWDLARLPVKLGGFGVHDPLTVSMLPGLHA